MKRSNDDIGFHSSKSETGSEVLKFQSERPGQNFMIGG